ncbi:MAG: iron ABC transporter permease [Turicibacter sp.]|nr:iron ABC transporter permease [Turicibacter sp.]
MKKRVILTICASFVAIVLGVAIGSVYIQPNNVLAIIAHNVVGLDLPEQITSAEVAIVWNLRLPRTLLAFCAGAALSVSGAVMQSVLRNPLASSYTLGVSSGASLGAALVIFMGVSLPVLTMFTLPVLGFVFGLATILIVMSIARQLDVRLENHTIILTGMVFALFVNSITTLMFAFFREGTQRMVFWQMGSFSMLDWHTTQIVAGLALVGVVVISRFKWELDIMTFGEEQAEAVGVNIRHIKLSLLIMAAALTGGTIAFVGIIGFVDLVAPHIVRKIFGAAHRIVIPMSALIGGTFMVTADVIARTVTAPVELPVGAVTAIIGAPFFAYIYFHRRKKES